MHKARPYDVVTLAALLLGCSGTSGSSSANSAGTTSTGGLATTGGGVGEGGSQPAGGKSSAGGPSTTASSAQTGGAQATGGAASSASGGTTTGGGNNGGGGRTDLASSGGASPGTGSKSATGGSSASSGGNSNPGGHSNTGGKNSTGGVAHMGGASTTGGQAHTGGASATGRTTNPGGSATTGGAAATGGGTAGGNTSTGSLPQGWLYTSGSKIYAADGSGSGTQWMGRGVNLDDIYLCGYNYTLWMSDAEQTLTTIVSGLLSGYQPTFVRVSLSMDSFPTVSSWLSSDAQYKTPMTHVINALGANPKTYVLVTLRTDASMAGPDDATQLPTDSSNTPDATAFPTGTDAVYVALVDTFAHANFVLFGISNEPGGNTFSNSKIIAAMSHAISVIRAEEDRLGVPHHIVSVQGNGWTSDISFYSSKPLPYDNVVYEVHGYPPSTASYTYSNIPVILGEYGSLTSSTAAAFYADIETKQIPSLAWDFEPYSDCSPDLLTVNDDATNLVPTSWGSIVQNYLVAHAQ